MIRHLLIHIRSFTGCRALCCGAFPFVFCFGKGSRRTGFLLLSRVRHQRDKPSSGGYRRVDTPLRLRGTRTSAQQTAALPIVEIPPALAHFVVCPCLHSLSSQQYLLVAWTLSSVSLRRTTTVSVDTTSVRPTDEIRWLGPLPVHEN